MIKIYEPFISKETLKYAHEALDSTWISSQGKYVELASSFLAEKLDVKHVLLTNNGTAATHLVALSLKFQNPNIKQLIVPNNVFVSIPHKITLLVFIFHIETAYFTAIVCTFIYLYMF